MKKNWTFTAWKSKDPCFDEWQGVGRCAGEVLVITKWFDLRRAAIAEAKRLATTNFNASTR
jgi:hypothetical protein